MNDRSLFRLLALGLTVGYLAGCGSREGAKTRDYLAKEHEIMTGLAHECAALPATQPPARPVTVSGNVLAGRSNLQQQAFVDAYRAYLSEEIKRGETLAEIIEHTQAKVRGLGAAGIDPPAVQLVTDEQAVWADLRLLLLGTGDFLSQPGTDFAQDAGATYFGNSLIPTIEGAMKNGSKAALRGSLDGVVKTMAQYVIKDGKRNEAVAKLREIATRVQRDLVAYETARAQLSAALANKFPHEDWSVIATKS